MRDLVIFAGNANRPLAERVSNYLQVRLGDATVAKFADGETRVEINETVRGADVFIVQPTCRPANDSLMELLVIIDALKRASASRITAVIPYFGYARQERKVASRSPISAKLVADMITASGVNRVISMELHSGAIQGFFNVPFDHLYSKPVFTDYFKGKTDNMVLVSPDAGGVERARSFAKVFGLDIAIIDKRRDQPNESRVFNVVGDVKGKVALLYDDIIDTAGSIVKAAESLKESGALRVYAACTHGVLSGPAVERINKSLIDEVIVTDTIPNDEKVKACSKLKMLTVSRLMGEAIRRIHHSDSLNSLFI